MIHENARALLVAFTSVGADGFASVGRKKTWNDLVTLCPALSVMVKDMECHAFFDTAERLKPNLSCL